MLTSGRYVLAVQDLRLSVQFYVEKLGFDVVAEYDGWTFVQRDAIVLMLGECRDAAPASALGDHSYFAYVDTADAAALHGELAGRGVTIIKPLQDEPWGMREFGIATLDGHRIMFGQEL